MVLLQLAVAWIVDELSPVVKRNRGRLDTFQRTMRVQMHRDDRDQGLPPARAPRFPVRCTIRRTDGTTRTLELRCRQDTRRVIARYWSGGILYCVFGELPKRACA